LTSPRARPDGGGAEGPLEELERLVAALEEEVHALRAGSAAGSGKVGPDQARRTGLLEGENQLLRQRIAAVREHVERLRTRLRFIEDRSE